MNKYKTIEQVWAAIDAGKTVYWSNTSYKLTIEETNHEWRKRCGFETPYSNRDDKCLRVTCISN